jgi:hypothetical protein
MEMNQRLLMDRYPAAPDGAVEVERERMNRDDVKYATGRLTQEAMEAYGNADALNRWWRQKRKAERRATLGNAS